MDIKCPDVARSARVTATAMDKIFAAARPHMHEIVEHNSTPYLMMRINLVPPSFNADDQWRMAFVVGPPQITVTFQGAGESAEAAILDMLK